MENLQVRRQFITDAVRRFIKNNPKEYKIVCDSIKKLKFNKDKFGSMDKEEFSRLTIRIPEPLFKVLEFSLDNPRFLESDLETNWFKKTFPMFRVGL